MRILEAQDVDLISPFPISEIKRLLGWMHCYRSFMDVDGGPQTDEEKEVYFREILANPLYLSWGIIDRANQLGYKHIAPLVGFASFEFAGPFNGYLHCASTRKAWGTGFMDQAGQTIVDHLFETYPQLTRLSSVVIGANTPAKNLAKRLGFKQDGLMKDLIVQNGIPKNVAHFGLLRREICQQLPQSSPLVEVSSAE